MNNYVMCITVSYILCSLASEEDSVRNREEQEEMEDTSTDGTDKNEVPFSDSLCAEEVGKSMQTKREDEKLRTLSGHIVNCQGKNLRINIPLTTPSRTFSAISYLVWEDLLNQSSRKCTPQAGKIHVNKTKLRHAEKMIKGGFIELYKGLGYLKVYRYNPKFLWPN